MHDFKTLKQEAKSIFFGNYLIFVLVALVLGFVNGTSFNVSYKASTSHLELNYGPFSFSHFSDTFTIFNDLKLGIITLSVILVMIAAIAGAVMVWMFVRIPFEYGCRRWFRHQVRGTKDVHITDLYRDPDMMRVIKTMFLRDLKILLYTFLLIVPGIMKMLEYYFVPQILEDHPDLEPKDALAYSSAMMDGRKMELFRFLISFFGWWLLGAVTFNLSRILYSNPYQYMSTQLLYEEYRREDGVHE